MEKGLVLLGLINVVQTFNINYYDCSDIDRLHQFDGNSACTPQFKTMGPGTRFWLLQDVNNYIISGYSCEEVRSVFYFTCGVWGHSKLWKPPKIEIQQPVTPGQCKRWVTSTKYQPASGPARSINIPGETIISDEDVGILKLNNGKVECQGQQQKIDNTMVADVLELSQTRIIVKQIKIKFEKGKTEVIEDHLILPTNCGMSKKSCQADGKVYIWDPPRAQCSLRYTKALVLKQIPGTEYLVDEDEQLTLLKQMPISSPDNCPLKEIFRTEYSDLFLSPVVDGELSFHKIQDSELNIINHINARAAYAFYLSEKEIQRGATSVSSAICNLQYRMEQNTYLHLGNTTFLTKRGDLLYMLKCQSKVSPIRASSTCYQDIPIQIEEGNEAFVDITSKILKLHSGTRPCSDNLPVIVKSIESWVALDHHIRRVATPNQFEHDPGNLKFYNFNAGGIYTKLELDNWRTLQTENDFHKSIIHTVSHGFCTNKEICSMDDQVPNFQLSNLLPTSPTMEMNPFVTLHKYLENCSLYLSVAVLIIETLRFGSFIIMLLITMMTEGVQGIIALLFLTCCSQINRIQRNSTKIRTREAHVVDQTESAPLKTTYT